MNKYPKTTLFVLLIAGFVTIFDLFVVNVAIVSIEKSLNATLTELTLIIVGYELAFGLLLITGGRLGDIFGKKTTYQIGMLFFIIASAFCAIAPTATLLVIARFIQGLAAALLFPQVYSSIRVNFSEVQAKKAFSYLGVTLGLAAIAGQSLGGWLITLNIFNWGWRSIFVVNIPIGIFAIMLSRYLYEGNKTRINLDWVGVFFSSTGISLSLLPFLMLPAWGWTWMSTLLFIIGVSILLCFIYYEIWLEKTDRLPLFSIRILDNRYFVIGLFAVLCVYATSSAFPLLLSILLQKGFGLTAFASGMLFIPSSIGFVISSFLAPYILRKYGDNILSLGALFYSLSYLLLICVLAYIQPINNTAILMPLLFFIGFTQGVIMTPILNIVLARVKEAQVGMASGMTATIQQVGAAMGATVVSVILQYGLLSNTNETYFKQLKYAVSYSLLFNVLMGGCTAILLIKLVRIKIKEMQRCTSL